MKKFALVAAVLLLTTGFVFAESTNSDSVIVSATAAPYLDVLNMTASTTIVLNPAGAIDVSVATANIATNIKGWKMTITAASAASGSATSALVGNDAAGSRIPYKLTVLGSNGGTIQNIAYQPIPATGIVGTYTSRAKGGVNGEGITLKISYDPENVDTWFANVTYQDTVVITLTTN